MRADRRRRARSEEGRTKCLAPVARSVTGSATTPRYVDGRVVWLASSSSAVFHPSHMTLTGHLHPFARIADPPTPPPFPIPVFSLAVLAHSRQRTCRASTRGPTASCRGRSSTSSSPRARRAAARSRRTARVRAAARTSAPAVAMPTKAIFRGLRVRRRWDLVIDFHDGFVGFPLFATLTGGRGSKGDNRIMIHDFPQFNFLF